MQIIIPYEKYNHEKILFCNRTDNTVITGGGFYRLMYCTKDITILGIQILFDVLFDNEEDLDIIKNKNNLRDFNENYTNSYTQPHSTNTQNTLLLNQSYVNLIQSLCEKTTKNLNELLKNIYINWCFHTNTHNKKLSHQTLNFNVEPIVIKALEQYKKYLIQQGNYIQKSNLNKNLSFVFKCSGVYDTEHEVGLSFRLNPLK